MVGRATPLRPTRARWCRVTTSASNPIPAIRVNRRDPVSPRSSGASRPAAIVAARRAGCRLSPKWRANRFSVPVGRTVMGTVGRSLTRAATVPSPPAATRQRQPGSLAESATRSARSSSVQATRALRFRPASSWLRRSTSRRLAPRPEPGLATTPTQARAATRSTRARPPCHRPVQHTGRPRPPIPHHSPRPSHPRAPAQREEQNSGC